MIKDEDRTVKNRLALVSFIVCMAGGVVLSVISFQKGNPTIVMKGMDSFGNICGEKENIKYRNSNQSGMDRGNARLLLDMCFADKDAATHKEAWYQRKHARLCVKECPTDTTTCRKVLEENNYVKLDNKTIKKDVCNIASGILPPQVQIHNRCVGQLLLVIIKLDHFVDDETNTLPLLELNLYISYLKTNVEEVSLIALSAAGLSFACIVLFCFIPSIMIYSFITIITVLVLSIETFLCYELAIRLDWIDDHFLPKAFLDCVDKLQSNLERATNVIELELNKYELNTTTHILHSPNITDLKGKVSDSFRKEDFSDKLAEGFAENLVNAIYGNGSYFDKDDNVGFDFAQEFDFDDFRSTDYFIVVFTVFTIITVLVILALLFLRKSIEIGITLFQEASVMTIKVPILMLFFLIKLICKLCIVVYGAVVLVFMFTSYTRVVKQTGFVEFTLDDTHKWSPLIIVWLMVMWNYCNACHQFITGYVVGKYYFQHSCRGLKCFGYNRCAFFACLYLFRYHLGSVACSAFVMTVFNIIYAIIWLLDPSNAKFDRERNASPNPCKNCYSMILFKIVTVVRYFLEYFNENTVFVVGLFGYGYFESSKRVYALLDEDVTLTATVHVLQNAFIFIAQLAVFISVALVAGVSYDMIARFHAGDNVSFLIGLFFAWIIIYDIFKSFAYNLQIFLICFAYDLRENNGVDRPYHSRKRIRKILMRSATHRSALSMTDT